MINYVLCDTARHLLILIAGCFYSYAEKEASDILKEVSHEEDKTIELEIAAEYDIGPNTNQLLPHTAHLIHLVLFAYP